MCDIARENTCCCFPAETRTLCYAMLCYDVVGRDEGMGGWKEAARSVLTHMYALKEEGNNDDDDDDDDL